jgi:hypothetical protein
VQAGFVDLEGPALFYFKGVFANEYYTRAMEQPSPVGGRTAPARAGLPLALMKTHCDFPGNRLLAG